MLIKFFVKNCSIMKMTPTRCRMIRIIIVSVLFVATINILLIWDISQKDGIVSTHLQHLNSVRNASVPTGKWQTKDYDTGNQII